MRILIVGQQGNTQVGGSLARAGRRDGHEILFADAAEAYRGNWLVRKLLWKFAGRRPASMKEFGAEVGARAIAERVDMVVATGFAPLDVEALTGMTRHGISVANFLTDDPWNGAQRAPWFLDALQRYSGVFSPRRANLADLRSAGVRNVHYLPFGYDDEIFFPDPEARAVPAESDVIFAGGADADRVPYIEALLRAGLDVALYGAYWDRHRATRGPCRGIADAAQLRRAISRARMALCLVRRNNRDGCSMRSFEVPAIGACMLAEDTGEHREIFGGDGEAVVYFRNCVEMVDRARWLLGNANERVRLSEAAHRLIVSGGHTYRDRVASMLSVASAW